MVSEKLVNPFIARSGLDPRVVVGRDEEIDFFETRLLDAMQGRCKHYVITGSWGIGKTVLLRQMKQKARKQGAWAALFYTRSFSPSEAPSSFARHILDNVAAELPDQSKGDLKKKQITGVGLGALGFSFQLQWDKGMKDKDAQIILRDGLLEMYKYAQRNKAKALVVFMDDVHNISPRGEHLTILRNALTDERLIRDTRILFVLASIDEGWSPYLRRDHPLGRLFMPRRPLGFLSSRETRRLIDTTLEGSMVTFDSTIRDRVHPVTRGHVFEIQALCEALFDQQFKGKVSLSSWLPAIQHTLLALADAQFASMIGRASEKELIALQAIAHFDKPVTPLSLQEASPDLKSTGEILRRLQAKGLIQRVARGEYIVDDLLFCEYLNQMNGR